MLNRIRRALTLVLKRGEYSRLPINWIKKDENAWLPHHLKGEAIVQKGSIYSSKIEKLAQQTHSLGAQPLWEGYAGNNVGGPTRLPNEVRTQPSMGNLFTYLVRQRRPSIVVEFGTAFGVSGMYFLAGLESNRKGKLLTFEPNRAWATIARRNLAQLSDRFELVVGTFEQNVGSLMPSGQGIDMALIDAVHTSEFVVPQLEIVISKSNSRALIILDDIDFSKDMSECWEVVATDRRFSASASIGKRVGIVELGS
jgi:predicted O-methyltransferase YrrM